MDATKRPGTMQDASDRRVVPKQDAETVGYPPTRRVGYSLEHMDQDFELIDNSDDGSGLGSWKSQLEAVIPPSCALVQCSP